MHPASVSGAVKPDVSKDPKKERSEHTYAGHLVMFPSGYGLYDLFGRNGIKVDAAPAKKVGKQHDWNAIEILPQGNRIRVAINARGGPRLARPGTGAHQGAADWPATALEQGAAGSAIQGAGAGDVPQRRQTADREVRGIMTLD